VADPTDVTSDDSSGRRGEALRWVRRKRIFYTIVGIYLSLSLMWFAIDLLDDSSGFWFYWPMLGTGLGVVVTGVVLGGVGGLFGANWERRQVEMYLNQQGDRWNGRDARSEVGRERQSGTGDEVTHD
jgi:2TM domain